MDAESGRIHQRQTARARALRRTGNPPEIVLWAALRDRRFHGYRFQRQKKVGSYIADFRCTSPPLVVEIDGAMHDGQPDYDRRRDEYMESEGYRVLRVQASDVLQNLESVLVRIRLALEGTAEA
jgi:very-short-patch-repair endonuclease